MVSRGEQPTGLNPHLLQEAVLAAFEPSVRVLPVLMGTSFLSGLVALRWLINSVAFLSESAEALPVAAVVNHLLEAARTQAQQVALKVVLLSL